MFDGIQLDTKILSEQEKQKLVNRFADIKAAFLALMKTINTEQEKTFSFATDNPIIMGCLLYTSSEQ